MGEGKLKPPHRGEAVERWMGHEGGEEGEYLVRRPPTHSPHFELDVEREKGRRREI